MADRDRNILLALVAGAVLLLIVGVILAGALFGSDGGGETTPPSLPTTTPTTTPTSTTPTPTTPTPTVAEQPSLPEGVVLRRGDESAEVRQLQEALVELGYSTGGVDAKFGPATEEAVRAFQTSSGLAEDGVVGPATLAALSKALSQP